MSAPHRSDPLGGDVLALVGALAEVLFVPRPVKAVEGTEAEYHRLLRDRAAHARDALLALQGEQGRPDLVRLAEWLYANAKPPTYTTTRDDRTQGVTR
jgi:hypothetical protein